MNNSQKYLGTKFGLVLCVDAFDIISITGRLYHKYQEEPIPIKSYLDLFLKGENFFFDIGVPKATQSDKNFDNKIIHKNPLKGVQIVRADDEILNEHGEQGTFIVRVQHRQHSSWQGRVTWVDEDKTVYFRSELELMKLIDGALNSNQFEEMSEE